MGGITHLRVTVQGHTWCQVSFCGCHTTDVHLRSSLRLAGCWERVVIGLKKTSLCAVRKKNAWHTFCAFSSDTKLTRSQHLPWVTSVTKTHACQVEGQLAQKTSAVWHNELQPGVGLTSKFSHLGLNTAQFGSLFDNLVSTWWRARFNCKKLWKMHPDIWSLTMMVKEKQTKSLWTKCLKISGEWQH